MPFINRWWDKEKDGPIEPPAYSIGEWVDCPYIEQEINTRDGGSVVVNNGGVKPAVYMGG